jgi:hypothetical protein
MTDIARLRRMLAEINAGERDYADYLLIAAELRQLVPLSPEQAARLIAERRAAGQST